MYCIIFKQTHNKALIGFSDNPKEFITEYLRARPLLNIHKWSSEYTVETDSKDIRGFKTIYASEIVSGETCYISLNENCMGFNDNH